MANEAAVEPRIDADKVDMDLVRSDPARALGNTMLAHAVEEQRQAHEEMEGRARTEGSNYPRDKTIEHENLGREVGDDKLRSVNPGVVRELHTETVHVKDFDATSRSSTAPTEEERQLWERQQANAQALNMGDETTHAAPPDTGSSGSGAKDDDPDATDAAQAKADELDVNLADVQGTGKDGKVTVADVEKHAKDNG